MTVHVRPLVASDLQAALPLFAGYQRFYEVERPDDERNLAFFGRFVAPSAHGLLLGAWDDSGALVGFACLYWTFSSVQAAHIVLMNDLFVVEAARGAGAGRALIEASVTVARDRGAHHLEWLTATDNAVAQRLYDRTGAVRSAWYGYEILVAGDEDRASGGVPLRLLREHIERFNQGVRTGDYRPMLELFTEHAELAFEGVPVGPFTGRDAIATAYRERPPDDTIEVFEPVLRGGEVVTRYAWSRDEGVPTGEMRLTADGDWIARLVVTFDQASGQPPSVTPS